MDCTEHISSQRRPVVGIMAGSFHTDYTRLLVESMTAALQSDGVGVCLFQGIDANRFLNLKDYVDEAFDHHYYSRYEYSRFMQLDALIISFGTISACLDPLSLESFLAALPHVPVILLENETQLPNGINITVDNYVGMKSLVDHLIEMDGRRKFIYISGPKGIEDAECRLSAYRDSLREHGILVQEERIAYGNFSDNVDALVEEMLNRFPDTDTIICANDEMAESAYRVVYGRGMILGEEIAVTGFDNNTTDQFMDPPLTSVTQDYLLIAEKAAEAVQAFLRGEQPQSVCLPTELVVRNSCGCTRNTDVSEDLAMYSSAAVIESRMKVKQMTQNTLFSTLMLRRLLNEETSVHSFFQKLGSVLHGLGADHSCIALLKEPLYVSGGSHIFVPDELRIHMVQNGDETQAYSRREAPILHAGELNSYQDPLFSNGNPALVFPLFYGDYHYGVFLVEPEDQDMLFYYILALEIGTGLRYMYLALDQQEARRALEEKNKILDYSATHDSLTGLYNRVGVMNQIYTFVHQQGQGSRFIAVMADLDHLKQINDTFGHEEGDNALRMATQLLKDTLPPGSPLGRTGGDEFTALFLATEKHTPEWFLGEIRRHCCLYNEASVLPYYEEISVGCFSFEYDQARDIPMLIKEADMRLYEAKKLRRDCVIRPNTVME